MAGAFTDAYAFGTHSKFSLTHPHTHMYPHSLTLLILLLLSSSSSKGVQEKIPHLPRSQRNKSKVIALQRTIAVLLTFEIREDEGDGGG